MLPHFKQNGREPRRKRLFPTRKSLPIRPAAAGGWTTLLALLAAAACGEDAVEPPLLASLTVAPVSTPLEALGDTVRLSASVIDNAGQAMPDIVVQWTTADPSVAIVDAGGLVTAVANGTAVVTATASGASGTTTIAVRQTPANVQVVAGAGQRARTGKRLREAVTVLVADGGGSHVAGVAVAFRSADGHGSVDPPSAVSDSIGRASTVWTLGSQPGVQTLMAEVENVTEEISAEASPPLPIISLADTAASAPEGGTVSLAVTVSPLPSSPLAVRYELVADEDLGTANADEADYTSHSSGSLHFSSTTPSAMIEVTIRDDDEIEPPRETFVVRLLASDDVYELGASYATVEIEEGVCDRTPTVSSAIVGSVGLGNCVEVTRELLANIHELKVSDFMNVTTLKAGDFDGMSSLRKLFLRHTVGQKQRGTPGLTELPAGVFDQLVNLKWLWMDGHSLIDLPQDIFADLRSLEHLHLSENNFLEISANMFAGLNALEHLTLYGSRAYLEMQETTVKTVDENAFVGLLSLRTLHLGYNHLTELPKGVFRNLDNLFSLNLSNNDLRRLPSDIFADLGNLLTLHLGANQLAEIPSDLFTGLHNLRNLSLSGNQLEQLPEGIFAGLRSLERATVEHNPGAPFELTLQLKRTDTSDKLAPGPATIAVAVAEGAPLPVAVPLFVSNGSASDTMLTLTPGATSGEGVTIVRASAGSPATYLDLGEGPSVPSQLGFVFRTGDPLVLFAETSNRPPAAVGTIPPHILQAGGQRARVDLALYFVDPDGHELTYEVRSISSLFSASVSDDRVTLTPHQEGESTLVLMAKDPEGFFVPQPLRVVVLPSPDSTVFNIDVVFAGHRSEYMERAVRESAQRWMQVITGDLPDIPLSGNISPPSTRCYVEDGEYKFYGVVDDLLVFVGIEEPYGGVAGRGGTCLLRESYLPYVSGLTINPQLDSEAIRSQTIKTASHEFGHALGFGTIWHQTGFLINPTWKEGRGADTHFNGALAMEAFDAAGGTDYSAGSKVPVENALSVDAHWKTSFPRDSELRVGVFQEELMAGFGNGPHLSAVTVQAFADLGYEVDVTKADPYRLYNGALDSGAAAMAVQNGDGEPHLDLRDDVHRGTLAVADKYGRIVRIIKR